jgi:hypothetical protein
MSTETQSPDIPEQSWTNPFSEKTPLYEKYDKIVRENRDIIIIIDDYYARRGTGKSVASLQLANGMDQTDEGIVPSKATLQPEELRNAYSTHPKRSGLVLDEGELGASNRQAMSKVNQALREIMSIGRVQEKYVVVNTPLKKFLDSDILKLADVWISMVRKGLGLVHFLEWEPYSEQLLSPRKQWIEFKDIPTGTQLRDVYNQLTRAKQSHIDGDGGTAFIPESEHEEALEKRAEEAKRQKRNEIVRGLFGHAEISGLDISQRMVAEAIGVSQGTVHNILKED